MKYLNQMIKMIVKMKMIKSLQVHIHLKIQEIPKIEKNKIH